MITDLFQFQWQVDQDGYETAVEGGRDVYGRPGEFKTIRPRGQRWRYYRPLETDGLWLRFAGTCRTGDGVLQFVEEYGLLHDAQDRIDRFILVAGRLWEIAEKLHAGDRRSAASIFNTRSLEDPFNFPEMAEYVAWSTDRPGDFKPAFAPRQLEDALKHQACEAITGNRQFRRCRNEGCANWFRLGPRAARDGGHTFTARREFCSDRCRIAHARRSKREAAHA
jgi:hypothetical protein